MDCRIHHKVYFVVVVASVVTVFLWFEPQLVSSWRQEFFPGAGSKGVTGTSLDEELKISVDVSWMSVL